MGSVVHNGCVVVLEIVGRVNQTLFGKVVQECYPTEGKKEMKRRIC